MTSPSESHGLAGFSKRQLGVCRLARAVVSPLLPGRGAGRLLRRLPRGKRIINVGSGPLVYRPDIINVDRRRLPGVTVLATAEALPFPDDSIDGALCEVTLEHVPDPKRVVAELVRCLKPGGLLYISAPFLQPLHSAPQDYTRWTLPGLRALPGDLELLESGMAGGPTATLTWVAAEYVSLLLSFGSRRLQETLAVALRTLLAPLKGIDLLLVHLPPADTLACLHYLLARKDGDRHR